MGEHKKSPIHSDDQEDGPEPERLITPAEEAGMDIANLDDPPQAEGDRDDEKRTRARDERGSSGR